jgi:hypothetical protein
MYSSWVDPVSRRSARAVPKIVDEFLKPCGNRVQVRLPFSPVLGFSHWNVKIGWFCGARQMQKSASLRSRQVKSFSSVGTRPKSLYGFGTMECKVTVAEFTAQRSWTGLKSSVPGSGLVIMVYSRVTDKVSRSHILRVCQNFFEFQPGPFKEWNIVSG